MNTHNINVLHTQFYLICNINFVILDDSEHWHVLKPKKENSCYKWLHVLSDYATPGPAMSGLFCTVSIISCVIVVVHR